MRYTILLILALASIQVNSQSKKFEFTEDNPSLINQFVVIEKDSMPISEGYSKIIEFIKMNYSSDKVIKSQIENKYIKIGSSDDIPSKFKEGKAATMDFDYVIEFRFKINKIQMKIVSVTRTTTLGLLPFDNPNNQPSPLWENGINNLPFYFNNLKALIKSSLDDDDGW